MGTLRITTASLGELGPRPDMHASEGHCFQSNACARQGALSITVF